jgi:hypothetical protein
VNAGGNIATNGGFIRPKRNFEEFEGDETDELGDTTGRRRQGLDDPARGADVGKGHFMSRVLFQGNFEEQNSEATVGDISQKV